jgi:hypothetical protein
MAMQRQAGEKRRAERRRREESERDANGIGGGRGGDYKEAGPGAGRERGGGGGAGEGAPSSKKQSKPCGAGGGLRAGRAARPAGGGRASAVELAEREVPVLSRLTASGCSVASKLLFELAGGFHPLLDGMWSCCSN